MNWGTQWAAQLEAPRFDNIVDPDAPAFYRRLRRRLPRRMVGSELAVTAVVAWVVAAVPFAMLGIPGLVVLGILGAICVAVAAAEQRIVREHVVSGFLPKHDGRAIVGEGLDLLVDISKRFAFARRKIDELPDLIVWEEVEEAVEAIRFDAARHAASLSQTEAEWADVRHAREHSPQAVLRDRLARRRAGELAILRDYQRTADRLMNRAADAVAAATIAADLGYDLETALASPAAAEANVRLEAAILRLEALTEAWRALDASTDLRAAALAAEQHDRDHRARRQARQLMARLGDVSAAEPGGDGAGTPADDPPTMG